MLRYAVKRYMLGLPRYSDTDFRLFSVILRPYRYIESFDITISFYCSLCISLLYRGSTRNLEIKVAKRVLSSATQFYRSLLDRSLSNASKSDRSATDYCLTRI